MLRIAVLTYDNQNRPVRNELCNDQSEILVKNASLSSRVKSPNVRSYPMSTYYTLRKLNS